MVPIRSVRTTMLELAYEEHGSPDGAPIMLLHGFPYDPRCYDEVAPRLAAKHYRVIVPYLRGFGPTRLLSGDALRAGQQSSQAVDLIGLLDGLAIPRAALADDGVSPPPAIDRDRPYFRGPYERRLLPGVGHDIPQEAPDAVLVAIADLSSVP